MNKTQNTIHSPEAARLRVAAYCRVSTDEDNQQNSYKTQIAYYKSVIAANPDWEMVAIYADEGLSGTQTKNRTQFNRMIRMCRRGRIDIILCKSISRFARNTVDCLVYVRELKSRGITIIFEKENINTMAANSEFTLSLYASFAQAESESISKNITWGIEKSFRDGKIRYRLEQTMGYRLGADGKPEIVEEEAVHVREIFQMFADGYSMGQIADRMTEKGVVRRCGSANWSRKNVEMILKNEKYIGRVILQKTFTGDCLTHKRIKNTGQKPQYVYDHAHPAIIDEETFEKVCQEFRRRSAEAEQKKNAAERRKEHTRYALNTLLSCPWCGANYRRTIWKYNGVRYGVWRCGNRLEGGKMRCGKSVSLRENELQKTLYKAFIWKMKDSTATQGEDGTGETDHFKATDPDTAQLKIEPCETNNPDSDHLDTKQHEAEPLDTERLDIAHHEIERFETDSMEFDEFLETGMIERIEVFSKNELQIRFRDGKTKKTTLYYR